jgi:hypothetical protein
MKAVLPSFAVPGGGGYSLAVAGEGGEDLLGALHPHIGPRVVVPAGGPLADVTLEGTDAEVRTALDLLGRELREPPLD